MVYPSPFLFGVMYLALLLAFTLASLAALFVVGIIALSSLERPYKLFTALTRGVPEGVLRCKVIDEC